MKRVGRMYTKNKDIMPIRYLCVIRVLLQLLNPIQWPAESVAGLLHYVAG